MCHSRDVTAPITPPKRDPSFVRGRTQSERPRIDPASGAVGDERYPTQSRDHRPHHQHRHSERGDATYQPAATDTRRTHSIHGVAPLPLRVAPTAGQVRVYRVAHAQPYRCERRHNATPTERRLCSVSHYQDAPHSSNRSIILRRRQDARSLTNCSDAKLPSPLALGSSTHSSASSGTWMVGE